MMDEKLPPLPPPRIRTDTHTHTRTSVAVRVHEVVISIREMDEETVLSQGLDVGSLT